MSENELKSTGRVLAAAPFRRPARAAVGFRSGTLEAAQAALEALRERFGLLPDEPAGDRMTFLDTFDWRLFRAGLTLTLREDGKGSVLDLADTDGSVACRLDPRDAAGFAWDLPEGELRDRIAPVLDMRRLLAVVTLEETDRRLRIVDDLEKTVVRAAVRTGTAKTEDFSAEIPPLLLLFPVRGYDRELAEVREFLSSGVGLDLTELAPLAAALEAVRRRPGDYSSKLVIRLDPATRADEAARTIHRALLDTIRQNEEGTIADTDSEFLHDLRVAVRRTRSALGQIREVFPPNDLERFKDEFRWLGQVTGPTRDMDVYVLKLPGYRESLPEGARRDLDPLRGFLERTRKEAQAGTAAALRSSRYKRLLTDWSGFLTNPPPCDAANAGRPIGDVASESIWRAWRRLLKKGGRIDDTSPVADLHRLRIDAKKLRYLLTFFVSLYPEEIVGRLIGSLKKLQDNLGDFNDFGVQQAAMKSFAARMLADGAPVETVMAMGRLVERLEDGEAGERRRFEKRFAEFSGKGNRELFRQLFGPRRKGGSR